jgi:transcription initiation factor TFIIIB Brf1 subunit/transcription initiation factor TFIIB
VAQVAEFPPGKVKQAIRRFQEELDRGYTGGSPAEYVHYLCDDLGVEDSIKDHAIEAAETFEENGGQQELHPAGVAGAAIYLSIDGALSQREIAAAIGVSKETIRLRVADLREVIPQ